MPATRSTSDPLSACPLDPFQDSEHRPTPDRIRNGLAPTDLPLPATGEDASGGDQRGSATDGARITSVSGPRRAASVVLPNALEWLPARVSQIAGARPVRARPFTGSGSLLCQGRGFGAVECAP